MFFLQAISVFWLITVVFIPIGAAILSASRDVSLNKVFQVKLLINMFYYVKYLLQINSLLFYQVVEIVDRYDAKCVPEIFKDDKVAFIKSSWDKTCIRTLNVSSP